MSLCRDQSNNLEEFREGHREIPQRTPSLRVPTLLKGPRIQHLLLFLCDRDNPLQSICMLLDMR